MMLYIKSFHVIAMVAWFAGLFYLPRLYVYHAQANDTTSLLRFKLMEHKLYYYIMWPAALITTALGLYLLSFNVSYYLHSGWMHVKLTFVIILWGYHIACGYFLNQFKHEKCVKSSRFFRIFNEIPTVLLIVIIIMVIAKPF